MTSVIDPTFVLSNHIEAGLWTVIGIGMAVGAVYQRGVVRRDCIVAAVTFAIFGASDLVEATTGAWWRPWWLLLWKATCLVAFLVLIVRYVRRRKGQSSNGCS
jgi:hypothetical protein